MKLSNKYYEKSKTKKVNPLLKKSLEILLNGKANVKASATGTESPRTRSSKQTGTQIQIPIKSQTKGTLLPPTFQIEPKSKNVLHALDIGCAAGPDSLFLANHNFLVDALDIDQRAINIVRDLKNKNINPILKDVSTFKFKTSSYDLVIAYWVLFFLGDNKLEQVIDSIYKSLKPNGIFSGILLGEEDSWKTRLHEYSYLNLLDIENLLSKFETIHLKEVKRKGKTLTGDIKFWHYYGFILRKN